MSYSKVYKSCSLFGSLRYFCNIKNSVHIINGPTGCSFFNCSSVFQRNKIKFTSEVPKIFSTNFNEDDVVFGGTGKLMNAIREVKNNYNPDVIFVYNCCVTEIIGENIAVVCKKMSEELHVKIVPVNSAGFKGDHKYGMKEASRILCKYFLNDSITVKKERCVNIIGEFDIDNANVLEFASILQKYGININIIFPGNCSVDEIISMPTAQLNFVICGNAAMNLAKYMKSNFNIEFILDKQMLMGVENFKQKISEVLQYFNIDYESQYDNYYKTLENLNFYKNYFSNKSAVVVGGSSKALGASEILTYLGIEVKMIFTEEMIDSNNEKDFYRFSSEVYFDEEAENLCKEINEINPDYIFTTLADIVLPFHFIKIDEQVSYSGYNGAVRYAKKLYSIDKSVEYRLSKKIKVNI